MIYATFLGYLMMLFLLSDKWGGKIIINGQQEEICKEEVMAYLQVLPQ